MGNPDHDWICRLWIDWVNDFIATMVERASAMRHAWPSLIRPLARVVRPRLKLMRGKIEVYEKDGELLCGCRLTLESLRCTFSYNRRLGAMELYGERPAAFPQMLFRHFRKRADIKGLARQLRTDDQYSRQVVGHIAKRFCEIMMEAQNL